MKKNVSYWKCTVCGEIFEGDRPPETCPVCGAGVEAFVRYNPEEVSFRKDKEMNVVIVGGGVAAVAAAKAIRQRNAQARIDVYSRELEFPYYRPMITGALKRAVAPQEFYLHPEKYYEEQRITFHLGVEITKIDPQKRQVRLDENNAVSYDKLLLATGGRCFMPPIQGSGLPQVIALREMADLNKLSMLLSGESRRVVIIGGGLLGLETADALSRLGHEITVLEACPNILPRQIDPEGAPLLERIIEESANVKLRNGVFVDHICGNERVTAVKTSKGEKIPCEIVVVSAGVQCNTELARDAGLKTGRAIEVNQNLRTSNIHVYAAGDCAACEGHFYGIWEPALDQGKIAGANIAGEKIHYKPKVYGATLQAFGSRLFAIGDLGTGEGIEYQHVSCKDEVKCHYKKLYFKAGELCGGVLLGDVSLTTPLIEGVNSGFSVDEAVEAGLC